MWEEDGEWRRVLVEEWTKIDGVKGESQIRSSPARLLSIENKIHRLHHLLLLLVFVEISWIGEADSNHSSVIVRTGSSTGP